MSIWNTHTQENIAEIEMNNVNKSIKNEHKKNTPEGSRIVFCEGLQARSLKFKLSLGRDVLSSIKSQENTFSSNLLFIYSCSTIHHRNLKTKLRAGKKQLF